MSTANSRDTLHARPQSKCLGSNAKGAVVMVSAVCRYVARDGNMSSNAQMAPLSWKMWSGWLTVAVGIVPCRDPKQKKKD